jgi:predicted TIM-barrel fold metal-dependent hydrolase
MKNGLFIIDADAHVLESEAAVREHLSETFRGRGAVFAPTSGGVDRGIKVNPKYQELSSRRERVIDPQVHLADMDREGIDVQVLFPTSGLGLNKQREREFTIDLCRAYNDWLSGWCAADSNRLKGVAIVPLHVDPQAAIAEMKRACGDLGLAGVVVCAWLRDRNVADRDFWPFYEACARQGVAVTFHGSGQDQLDAVCHFDSFYFMHAFSHVPQELIACTAVFTSGLLEELPELKVAFLEAGSGWVPYWMEHLDEEWEACGASIRPFRPLQKKPSEIMAGGNVYVTCKPDEQSLPYVIQRYGADFLLFPSDYPHFDCAFPFATSLLADREDITPEEKRKIFGDNPRRLYGLGGG